jgi:hypothetical protein
MPVVAIVDGVKIMFFFKDHGPPHFHVEYAEYSAKVSIATLKIIEGRLPASKRRPVLQWAKKNQEALSTTWRDVQARRKPGRIE